MQFTNSLKIPTIDKVIDQKNDSRHPPSTQSVPSKQSHCKCGYTIRVTTYTLFHLLVQSCCLSLRISALGRRFRRGMRWSSSIHLPVVILRICRSQIISMFSSDSFSKLNYFGFPYLPGSVVVYRWGKKNFNFLCYCFFRRYCCIYSSLLGGDKGSYWLFNCKIPPNSYNYYTFRFQINRPFGIIQKRNFVLPLPSDSLFYFNSI